MSFRRQSPGQRRQRVRSGLPGVKYMVYTGELNNRNNNNHNNPNIINNSYNKKQ